MVNWYTYIIIFLLSISQCFGDDEIINPYSVSSGGCGTCENNNIVGQLTDMSIDTTTTYWWATKYTASSSSDCVCRIRALLSAGSDPSVDDTIGYAVYGDTGLGYPDGSNILSSGTAIVTLTGDAQTISEDLSSVISITNTTVYWLAYIEPTGDGKIEAETTGGAGIRYMSGETTAGSPPTDWSGSTEVAAGELSLELTY